MNKDEFLRQLEQLLGSISPEERADAMAYYRSYFEDAGIENEASILEELESPQKVAQSILKDTGAENTAAAKQQEQTKSSYEYSGGYRNGSGYGNNNGYGNRNGYGNYNSYGNQNDYGGASYAEQNKQKNKNAAQAIGIAAVILLSPVWGTILITIVSVIIGLICALFGVILAVVAVMGAMLIVGISMIVTGIGSIGSGSAAASIGVIGVGFLALAAGILIVIATVWVCGVFVPWVCREIAGGCKNLWNKRKGKKLL